MRVETMRVNALLHTSLSLLPHAFGWRSQPPLRGTVATAMSLFVAVLCFAATASATTMVLFSDEELVEKASLIIVGRVQGALPISSERAVTEWLVTVERVLKGGMREASVVVRSPGGETLSGAVAVVFGAPRFQEGERVLLFLDPDPEGEWQSFHLAQGVFHDVLVGSRRAAVRDLSEVHVLGHVQEPVGGLRAFDDFVDWIDDHLGGFPSTRKYVFRPAGDLWHATTDQFTLLPDFVCRTALNIRWTDFDRRGSMFWRNAGVLPWLPGGGAAEFFRGLGTWNAEPATDVNLRYSSATDVSVGAGGFDGQNVLIFNDPFGEIQDIDTAACKGTLAIGVPKAYSCSPVTFNGQRFLRIQEADIVVNNGLDCFFTKSGNASKMAEELFAHELGHTLGLGHSSMNEFEPSPLLRDAQMFHLLHDDGRGGRLRAEDVAALHYLYRRGSGNCPANALCLLNDRFRVMATWQNQFDGSSGLAGAQRASDVAGYLYFTHPSNTELIVKILDFGSEIKFFWGQLTNLHYTISVVDTRTGVSKAYSRPANDCGGLDDHAFLSSPAHGDGALSSVTAAASACRADADTLCLLGNRFSLEMAWRNQFNNSMGVGIPKKLSDLTGAFGFTSAANLELLVKTIQFPDRVAVFWGALSNLEYTLRVTDTLTGTVKVYHNPAGQYCGGLDNTAF